jgi:uncharacterized membrane protein
MNSFGGTLIVIGLTLALAGIDLAEAVLAKEWATRRSPWLLVAGLVASALLFAILVVALRYTEMSTLTIGWIVVLQLGLMVTESVRYGVSHAPDRWVVMGAIVCLLAYLVISPSSSNTANTADTRPSTPVRLEASAEGSERGVVIRLFGDLTDELGVHDRAVGVQDHD